MTDSEAAAPAAENFSGGTVAGRRLALPTDSYDAAPSGVRHTAASADAETQDRAVRDAAPPLAGARAAGRRAAGLLGLSWPWWALLAGFIFLVHSVLAPFLFAVVAAYVLGWPLRRLAARLRLPVPLLAALLYAAGLGALGAAAYSFGPALMQETGELAANGPDIIESLFIQTTGAPQIAILGANVSAAAVAAQLQTQLADAFGRPADALWAAERLMALLIEALLFLVALFYLLLDGPRIAEWVLSLTVAPAYRPTVERVDAHLRAALGQYVRGLALLVLLMSAVSYAGLELGFHLRSALPIAIATGFMEIVPILGPIVATALAASVGLFQGGPGVAAGIVVMYVVLRQLEDQLVMPQVIGRAVHLHPLATILAVVCGGAIAGAPGMLIAVPVAAAGKILLDELTAPRRAAAPGAPVVDQPPAGE